MAESFQDKGDHSRKEANLQPPNMSTCQMTDWVEFCNRFDKESKTKCENKDDAIDRYSNLIFEGEKCLDVIKDSSEKEHLKQKLAQSYNERGLIKYQKVDFDDAIEDFTKALSYDSSSHATFYNRGLIHYRLARYNEAIADMKNSLKLKPDFESAQSCLQQAQTDKLNSR